MVDYNYAVARAVASLESDGQSPDRLRQCEAGPISKDPCREVLPATNTKGSQNGQVLWKLLH